MDVNRSSKCVDDKHLVISGSTIEYVILAYLSPPTIILGLIGNFINLLVLLSKEMRSRANSFLAALALFDIICIALMIPHSLANFDVFGTNYYFRYFYFSMKTQLITFANWSSAVAIWLVVTVCAERVLGIRYPFYTRKGWRMRTTVLLVVIITVFAGVFTFYNHYHYHCVMRYFCNDTQILSKCFDITQNTWYGNMTNPTSHLMKVYIKWSVIINAVFVVIVPNIMLIFLNGALIYYVKRRSFLMLAASTSMKAHTVHAKVANGVSNGKCIANGKSPSPPSNSDSRHMSISKRSRSGSTSDNTSEALILRRNTDQLNQQKTEHKVAITVCAIVTCFTLTQGPSAIVSALNSLSDGGTSTKAWYTATSVASFLVVVGKTLNFILFCMSSSNFRRRLTAIARAKIRKNRRRSSGSNTAITLNRAIPHCRRARSHLLESHNHNSLFETTNLLRQEW